MLAAPYPTPTYPTLPYPIGNPGYINGLPLLGATRYYDQGETDTMIARVPVRAIK